MPSWHQNGHDSAHLDSVHRMSIELRVAQQPQRVVNGAGPPEVTRLFHRGWTMGASMGLVYLPINYHEDQASMGTYTIHGSYGLRRKYRLHSGK